MIFNVLGSEHFGTNCWMLVGSSGQELTYQNDPPWFVISWEESMKRVFLVAAVLSSAFSAVN